MRLPFVSLVFSLLAVASVLFCALLDQPLLALVPLGLIVLYIVVAFWLSEGVAADLEWFGDHVYFLGYVSTITAFAGVVLRAWLFEEFFDDPAAILLMGGVALLTTVAGLIGMTFLRSWARTLAQVEEAEIWATRVLPAGRRVASAPRAGATTGEGGIPTAAEAVPDGLGAASNQATAALERLGVQLEQLNGGLSGLHQVVSRSNPEVQSLARNVAEVQAVLDGFVEYLGSKLETETAAGPEPRR